jgi:hypothetical protein
VRIIKKILVHLAGNIQNFLLLNQVLQMVSTLVHSDKDNENPEGAYLLSLEIKLKFLLLQL